LSRWKRDLQSIFFPVRSTEERTLHFARNDKTLDAQKVRKTLLRGVKLGFQDL